MHVHIAAHDDCDRGGAGGYGEYNDDGCNDFDCGDDAGFDGENDDGLATRIVASVHLMLVLVLMA
eukprot:3304073-Pyramimonas_sp.AAC.1